MKLAIKIDVDGLGPALSGAPRLADLLENQAAGASFLFSVGPDRSGTHIAHLLQRGLIGRAWRTRRIRRYSVNAALFGTLLPAPNLAEQSAEVMRAVRDRGFETGVRAFDHVHWRYTMTRQKPEWIAQQINLARQRYTDVLGEPPTLHGAPGWQFNRNACRLTQRFDFAYGSDTRGTHPFIPVFDAEVISCPQLPTTLPTLDELVAKEAMSGDAAVARLLELTEELPHWGHVYSANAAFEGFKLLPQFEQLLRGWRRQGYELMSLRDYLHAFQDREMPYHEVLAEAVPGRPGTVATQGKEFLGPSEDLTQLNDDHSGDSE